MWERAERAPVLIWGPGRGSPGKEGSGKQGPSLLDKQVNKEQGDIARPRRVPLWFLLTIWLALQLAVEALEQEKQGLQNQIAQVLEGRQQLAHLKMSLSLEVATYRYGLKPAYPSNTVVHTHVGQRFCR